MRKKIIAVLILAVISISCNDIKNEYYPNGKLKKEYSLSNGKLDKIYKEYYKNGLPKVIH